MRFAVLVSAYFFWLVIGLAVFFFWANKQRQKTLQRFADQNLLNSLTISFDARKYRLKQALIVISLCLAVLAVMRPQYGFNWQKVQRKGLDIMIAVDVSKSMLAEDVKPNRLERTKLALADFVKNLKGDRVGLIAFSGAAFIQCPLTVDYGGFLLCAKPLDVDLIPKGGTSISSAINEAITAFEPGLENKVLLIITDGEDHDGNALETAKLAQKEGIKIFCIGIGTNEGELIRVADSSGNKTFLKDENGAVIKSRLNEDILQEISLATGGSYLRSGAKEFGLDLIYKEKLARMEKRDLESKMYKQYEERFQFPLALAFLLLLLEFLVSERK